MREIEVFIAVAEELHFGRAAERLHVTSSSISQTIRTLENRVGGRLFDRTSRSVRLTALGRRLLDAWQPAHNQLLAGLRETQQAASSGAPLRIAYTETLVPCTLERLTDAYRKARPDRRLQWVPGSLEDVFNWRHNADMRVDALVRWFPPGVRAPEVTGSLRAGPPVRFSCPALMVSPDHHMADRDQFDVEELTETPLLDPQIIVDNGERWAPATTPSGAPIPLVRSNAGLETVIATIQNGDVAHFTPAALADITPWQWMSAGTTVIIPISGLPPFTCRVAWQASQATSAIIDFADLAAQAGADAGWLDLPLDGGGRRVSERGPRTA